MTSIHPIDPVERNGKKCCFELSAGRSVLPAGQKSILELKASVTGFEVESESHRPSLNIALVIDRSGSMSGRKIEQAKEAAACAVRQMRENDIVSVVIYDDEVEVLVPATKCTDEQTILSKIKSIRSGGATALYDGTVKGADEVKKFFAKGQVNRVILLSDGMANVGPSTPEELGELGGRLADEGISVTTLGLGEGYDEDLMQKLAQASDGNHVFITSESSLVEVFDQEFQSVTSVVASEAVCEILCAEGVRPIRVLNRDAEIDGGKVRVSWNQIYSGHERYVLLEVEVPSGANRQKRSIASGTLKYANLQTRTADTLTDSVEISYSVSEDDVRRSANASVLRSYAEQSAASAREEAIRMRDAGDLVGAQYMLYSAVNNVKMYSPAMAEDLAEEANEVKNDSKWNGFRKRMRARANSTRNQQKGDSVK